MNLKQIKSMFQVGQTVRVTRTGGQPLTVVGNTGNTTLPANDVTGELRTIQAVKSAEWMMKRETGATVHTGFPKASQVIEARPGFVKWTYDNGLTITVEANIAAPSEIAVGKCAVLTDIDGTVRSVRVFLVNENGCRCHWLASPHTFSECWVPRTEFSRLQMFPDDCKFMAVS